LKIETTKPAGSNFLQQQTKFDDFIDCYNHERPHQAVFAGQNVGIKQVSDRTWRSANSAA